MKYLQVTLFCLLACMGHAQTSFQDSVQQELSQLPNDSVRWQWLRDQATDQLSRNPGRAAMYAKPTVELAKALNDNNRMTDSYMLLGNAYRGQGISDLALENYILSAEAATADLDTAGIGLAYNNIGIVHLDQSSSAEALHMFQKALPYLTKSEDLYYLCIVNNNLGAVYEDLGEEDLAIDYYLENLKLQGDSGNKRIRAASFNNIGMVYLNQGNDLWARDYFKRAITEKRHFDDPSSLSNSMINLAQAFTSLGDYQQSQLLLDSALRFVTEVGDVNTQSYAFEALADLHSALNEPETALNYFRKYDHLKDSLETAAQKRHIARIQSAFQLQQAENEIGLLNSAQADKDALIEQQRLLIWSFGLALLMVLTLSVSLFLSVRQRRGANQLLVEKNEEILLQREAIVNQNEMLSQQNSRLEELNQEIQAVMHVAAHDLKAPLSRATGLANLIPMAGPLNAEQEKYLELIRQVSLNGATMIRDLLDLQNIENSARALPREDVDLKSLLTDSTESFEVEARKKAITMDVDIQERLSNVSTNKQAVQRAFENILSNAIKFSPKDRLIHVRSWRVNGHVCISVKDEGPGIKPEERMRLFKKFQKLSAQPTGNETSTGLGLAITKALIDRLEGSIDVESHPGIGAEFRITLPAG